MAEPTAATPSTTVLIDCIPIDPLTFDEAVARIAGWAIDGSGGYVCTPNVDHVVRARRDRAFLDAVLGARLRVPDGMGIVYGSRLARRPLAGTVTGRLLPEAVGRALRGSGTTVALVGGRPGSDGRPGSGEQAAARLRSVGIEVVATLEPAMGFELGSAEDAEVVRALREARPGVAFVGLGAPKQELWMARHAGDLPGTVLVGVGGAIDVLGGRVATPPRWLTRVGLEWLFRLAQEPRRLARRYLWDDPRFFAWMLAARFESPSSR